MDKRNSDDDQQELIDAEFESMVAGLNLNQDTGSTYLDEITARDNEVPEYMKVPKLPRNPRNIFLNIKQGFRNWFHRTGDADDDGAVI